MGLARKRKQNRRKAKTDDVEYFAHTPSLVEDKANDWATAKFNAKDTPETRRKIIDALHAGHTISGAAIQGGIHPCTLREWREKDPAFAVQIKDAIAIGDDFLEEEARRRAFCGVEKPVFQGGCQVGVVREYSDRLVEFMMTARRPDRFGKQRLEHGGLDGQPIKYETEVTFVAPEKSDA